VRVKHYVTTVVAFAHYRDRIKTSHHPE